MKQETNRFTNRCLKEGKGVRMTETGTGERQRKTENGIREEIHRDDKQVVGWKKSGIGEL